MGHETMDMNEPCMRAIASIAIRLFLLLCVIVIPQGDQAASATDAPSAQSLADPAEKHVLVLYSGVFLPAYRQFAENFQSTLEAGGVPGGNIHFEMLELTRDHSREYQERLAGWLRGKYGSMRVEVIVTVDELAQDFLVGYGQDLCPGTPAITVLAPTRLTQPVPGRRTIQIQAQADFKDTLEAALRLFPSTKQVYLVAGTMPVDRLWLSQAREALAPYAGRLRIEYSDSPVYEEVEQKIASLPRDALVMYICFYRDATGRRFVPADAVKNFARAASVPVFGVYDTPLGQGVLGGIMFSYGQEGTRAGRLALDTLSGRPVFDAPLQVLACMVKPMFDWNQLKRWNAMGGPFPEGSAFINRPPPLWDHHKGQVVGAAASLAALAGLSIALLVLNRRRKAAEQAALLNEARFRAMVDQAPEAIIVTDLDDGVTVHANANALNLFGFEKISQLDSRHDFFLENQPDGRPARESMEEHREAALAGGEVVFERAMRDVHGQERVCEVRLVRLPSDGHRLVRTSWIDITGRKQAEAALEASLKEKEILLREIHHRVKNNLQIISSLLYLQEQELDSPDALDALATSRGRVLSMALIHEQLYKTQDFARIDLADYLGGFIPRLISTYKDGRDISFVSDLAPIALTIDQANPFCLIVNELVTNAVKHAFKGRDRGTIRASATTEKGIVTFLLEDDGSGLPRDFQLREATTLGLLIVTMLTKQLHGEIEVLPCPGTCFRIEFPLRAT